jgi:hypothetical protein
VSTHGEPEFSVANAVDDLRQYIATADAAADQLAVQLVARRMGA